MERPAFRKKIFCVGLPKTGTTTLGYCLKTLGYKHKTFDPHLTVKVRQGDTKSAIKVARRYEAMEDWPWFLIYELLADVFPSAKFILTKRISPEAYAHSLWRFRAKKGAYDGTFVKPNWWDSVIGTPPEHWDEAELVNYYIAHNSSVEKFFRKQPDRLLIVNWEEGDSWEELCNFLGKKPPNIPFPHLNKTT